MCVLLLGAVKVGKFSKKTTKKPLLARGRRELVCLVSGGKAICRIRVDQRATKMNTEDKGMAIQFIKGKKKRLERTEIS